MSGLLTRRALVLAKIESTQGTDANPTATADAVQVIDPVFSLDANILDRRVATLDLSMQAHSVGRKIGKLSFSTEVTGSNTITSFIVDPPRLDALLRMCGLAPFVRSALGQCTPGWVGPQNLGANPTFARGGSLGTSSKNTFFTVVCTQGGPSGTARLAVLSSDNAVLGANSVPQPVTSGSTVLAAGNSGFTLTPTWTGNLVAGDFWIVAWLGRGSSYSPRSSGFETGTLYAYFDGLLHRLTGAAGTLSLAAEAGDIPRLNFEFTGDYNPVTDAAIPTNAVFSEPPPNQVELGNLVLDQNSNLMIAGVTLDLQNVVSPRVSVNDTDGIRAFRIAGRNPVATISPEATLESYEALKNIVGNLIRNPFGEGITGATVAPTYWLGPPPLDNAITTQWVGSGIENGIPFVDLSISGTAASAGGSTVGFEALTQIAAAQGYVGTSAVFLRLISGSLTGLTIRQQVSPRVAAGTATTPLLEQQIVPTTAPLARQRFSLSSLAGTFTDPLTAYVVPYLRIDYALSAVVAAVIRIGLPTFNNGASPVAIPNAPAGSVFPFWADMASGARVPFIANIGGQRQNRMTVFAPRAQIAGVTYGDREGVRTYDVNLALKSGSPSGDDELMLHFG